MTFPRVLPDFVTPDELRELDMPKLWHPSVVIDDEGRAIEDPMRTSSQTQLCRTVGNLMHQRLQARVPEAKGVLQFEEGSWVRYMIGQEYREHGDAAGLDHGREWTVLLCIQAAEEGGQTQFPALSRTFSLKPGEALVWPNYTETGNENEAMDHAALRVERGEKVVINAWISVQRS